MALSAYISYTSFMFCGKDGWGNARCPLTIESSAGGPSSSFEPSLWIYLGSKPNQMRMRETLNFDLEDIEVFGDDGKRLDLNEPVRIVGELKFHAKDKYRDDHCSMFALKLTQASEP